MTTEHGHGPALAPAPSFGASGPALPTTSSNAAALNVELSWHKPLGRGRRFERMARGIARRLRIPWVRSTLWERAHPESRPGKPEVEFGHVWTSTSALADFSFACTCHKRERYSRKSQPERVVAD